MKMCDIVCWSRSATPDKGWQALLIELEKRTMIRKKNTTLHCVGKRMSLEDIDVGA